MSERDDDPILDDGPDTQSVEAIEAVLERLAAFGAEVDVEYLDGYLTALAVARRRPAFDEWIEAMVEDAFDRAYGDPAEREPAKALLEARLDAIAADLAPQRLVDEPDALHLRPIMAQWDDEARAEALAELPADVDRAEAEAMLRSGHVWSLGFMDAVGDFDEDWPGDVGDKGERAWYEGCMQRASMPHLEGEQLTRVLKEHYPGQQLERDEIVDEMLFAIQDLRLHWLEHPATHAPIRHESPKVGRNDPCPCGSGRKFKKCHGA